MSWVLFERIGGALAYPLARVGAPPAAATVLGGVAGILGALFLATATDRQDVVLAAAVLLTSYSLDCTDGQLARATRRTSDLGAWLDVAMDAVVIAFMSVALAWSLLEDGELSLPAFVVAGSYGASRTVSLLTSSRVKSQSGGMRLTGTSRLLRTVYVAAMDTPVVYVALCASRLDRSLLMSVMVVLTLMTATQTLVSAHHHFASTSVRPAR